MSDTREKSDCSLSPACMHYDVLLMEYASGGLDDALSLIVASHLAMSAAARRHMALYESLGGTLMSECCEPVAMLENSLAAVLEQLTGDCNDDQPCTLADILHDFGIDLPQPLHRHLTAQDCHKKKWHRARRGVQVMSVPVPAGAFLQAFLIRATSGAALPVHKLTSREYALVLEGRLRGHSGIHDHGDLFIVQTKSDPRPVVDSDDGCVCLVLSEGRKTRQPSILERFFPFGW